MMPQATYKTDCTKDFRRAMAAIGLVTNDQITADGQLHRVHIQGDKLGSKNGFYVLFGDTISAGTFGSWKTGQKENWCSRRPLDLTESERGAFNKRMEKAREQREQEQARIHAKAREDAYEIWEKATAAQPEHPYLKKKGVGAYGLKLSADGQLAVPVRDINGILHGVQFINAKGEKRFLTGTAKKGHFHLIGEPAETIFICEGYATAATVHEATGKAVFVAFDASNLKSVAEAIRQKWPDMEIVIAADDDQWTDGNPGRTKGREAALASGGKMTIPQFKDTSLEPTDFNDLHQAEGPEAVREQLEMACMPDDSEVWSEPKPLNPANLTTAADFPIDALPDIIGEAVQEYQAFGQQPMSLVASSALGAVSLCCQCHADIERADNLCGPTSLYVMVQGVSGERKSAADKILLKGAREWLRAKKFESVDSIKMATANLRAWEATEAGFLNQIKRCNDPGDKDTLKNNLEKHYKEKPDPVNEPELFFGDSNQASLLRDLANNLLYGAALGAAEGGLVIGGDGGRDDNAISFFSVLNTLWDGEPVSQRRIGGNRTIDGKRLTVNLMAQPQVIKKLITGNDGLAKGIGLFARILLAAPVSTIGTRLFRESGEMLAVERFNDRVRELLEKPVRLDDNGRLDPPVLTLSEDAFNIWREFYNDIEQNMAPHSDFEAVKDVASKSAENAARLAGCFHVFANSSNSSNSASSMDRKITFFNSVVSADTMRRACKIAMFYLSEALRIFGYIDTPREIIDAERLLSWWQLKRQYKMVLPKGELQREGPIRNKDRLNSALIVLEQAGYLLQESAKGSKGINIKINPIIIAMVSNHD